MRGHQDDTPFIAIIDDDEYSAELLTRALLAQGAPLVRHLGDGEAGWQALLAILGDVNAAWPGLLIVDIKAHSAANAEFVARHQAALRQRGIPMAVMTQPLSRAGCQDLLEAGASSVFFRQAERDAYRREAEGLVNFWARHQRLDAVGM